jgi:secondary thiamine-phosphate synthase enzyme
VENIEITVTTGHRSSVFDITDEVTRFAARFGDGLLSVFVPHATAGLAIIEMGSGSDVDLQTVLDSLLPADSRRWRHAHGSPGHGRDHVLPAFITPSLVVPVVAGRPALGVWQSVVVVDTNVDNPQRRVRLSFLGG